MKEIQSKRIENCEIFTKRLPFKNTLIAEKVLT